MNTRIALAATLAAACLTLTACGGEQAADTKTTPTASATPTASPSKNATDQLIDWRDNGGGKTLNTLVTDLGAVDEASDPVDLPALLDACSTLTADLEVAQQGDPIPDEETNRSWSLALEHLTASASACTTGAAGDDQASFDLMAAEMEIGIKHLDTVSTSLDKFL